MSMVSDNIPAELQSIIDKGVDMLAQLNTLPSSTYQDFWEEYEVIVTKVTRTSYTCEVLDGADVVHTAVINL